MNTLLITVDALRADHLGQYAYDRDPMPVLDRIADDGAIFENAFSNGPYTRISVPALHTSRHLAYQSIDEFPTIAEILGRQGIRTAGIGTQTGFADVEGGLGFDEFIDMERDDYHDRAERNRPTVHKLIEKIVPFVQSSDLAFSLGKKAYHQLNPIVGTIFNYLGYTSAAEVTDRAIEWIKSNDERSFFLWVHYMEGHRPYGVHDDDHAYVSDPVSEEEIKQLMKKAGTVPDEVTVKEHRRILDLYDSDLRYCSRHINRLFDFLESTDLWADSNVVFTSDHGEEFYDHGEYFHRNLPYRELIHVPLLVKAENVPDGTVTGERELLDVAPTIVHLHGCEPDVNGFQGRLLRDDADRSVISLGSAMYEDQVVGIRSDGWKYIHTGSGDRLFDLELDPREQDSVADRHPETVRELRSTVPDELYEATPEELRDPESVADRERLKTLGYLEISDDEGAKHNRNTEQ